MGCHAGASPHVPIWGAQLAAPTPSPPQGPELSACLSATFTHVCSAPPATGPPPGQGSGPGHSAGSAQSRAARCVPAGMEAGDEKEESPLPAALGRFQLSEEYGFLLPSPLVGHGRALAWQILGLVSDLVQTMEAEFQQCFTVVYRSNEECMRGFGLGRFIGQIPHFKNDCAGCNKRHRGEEQELCYSDSGCGFTALYTRTRREFRWQISRAASGAICHRAQFAAGALRDRQFIGH